MVPDVGETFRVALTREEETWRSESGVVSIWLWRWRDRLRGSGTYHAVQLASDLSLSVRRVLRAEQADEVAQREDLVRLRELEDFPRLPRVDDTLDETPVAVLSSGFTVSEERIMTGPA